MIKRKLKTHCKEGHLFTKKTTAWSVCRGYKTRTCRICRSNWDKMKYHNNPEYREAKKARNKTISAARYAAIKAGDLHVV